MHSCWPVLFLRTGLQVKIGERFHGLFSIWSNNAVISLFSLSSSCARKITRRISGICRLHPWQKYFNDYAVRITCVFTLSNGSTEVDTKSTQYLFSNNRLFGQLFFSDGRLAPSYDGKNAIGGIRQVSSDVGQRVNASRCSSFPTFGNLLML